MAVLKNKKHGMRGVALGLGGAFMMAAAAWAQPAFLPEFTEDGAMPTCRGGYFNGDYMAQAVNIAEPPTKDMVNRRLHDEFVAALTDEGPFMALRPTAQAPACEAFMEQLMETGLFTHIEPNWIPSIGRNGPAVAQR